MKPMLDALDKRLDAAGWTCSMVQDWRALRRLGWSPQGAAWLVKRKRWLWRSPQPTTFFYLTESGGRA